MEAFVIAGIIVVGVLLMDTRKTISLLRYRVDLLERRATAGLVSTSEPVGQTATETKPQAESVPEKPAQILAERAKKLAAPIRKVSEPSDSAKTSATITPPTPPNHPALALPNSSKI